MEDGKHSFAGRYESIVVKEATPENILAAIGEVYKSLNSDKAIQYRQEHDIESDIMGIVG